MTPLAPYLTSWLREYLPRQRGASAHTTDTYAHAFRLLLCFASERCKTTPSKLALEQLDAGLIVAFLEYLEVARGNSPSTRNARLAAIKSFAHYLEYRLPSAVQQLAAILAIPAKKTDQPLVDFLDRDEMQALLDAPDPSTRLGARDRAMLHIAFAAGLRVSELISLCLDDVTWTPHPCVRVMGKGRRERVLPLWNVTARAIRQWLAIRGGVPGLELFVSARGGRLTRAGFEHILRKHVKVAELVQPSIARKRVSPHVLRHTCAMHTLRATHDVRKVALWLGHATMQSTEMYLRADPEAKLEALASGVAPTLRKGRFTTPDALIAMLRAPPPP